MTAETSYVLVTAARNEGRFIENTIRSILGQELQPTKWIIVSDNSTDDTETIVEKYASMHSFIQLHRLTKPHPRNFAAQSNAINFGLAQLRQIEYAFIGNLDADITFDSSYFAVLLEKFQRNAKLGVGGGMIYERCFDGTFRNRRTNSVTSVAHAVQFFRRECFEAVGGAYLPLPHGGPDTYAEITARQMGWQIVSFPDLIVFHHRPDASDGGLLRGRFRQGRMDYSLGTLPAFELFKVLKRIPRKPYIIGAMARLAGFLECYVRREKRAVSEDFVAYFREEQMLKLLSFLQTAQTKLRPIR